MRTQLTSPQISQHVGIAKKIQFQFESLKSLKIDKQGVQHQQNVLHGISTIAIVILHHYHTQLCNDTMASTIIRVSKRSV